MATIRPFSGLRYDLERAGDPADLLAPPYDVVDAAARAEIGARSANNCIHVILPEGEGAEKYANGAAQFRRLVDDALVRDAEPGIYVYHQRFEVEGRTYTRKGFVCLIELTPFGEGPVLAHERTLAGPKKDRLDLMRACDAHLELVFGLFSDPDRSWEAAVGDAMGEPVLACDYGDAHHTLYRVHDPAACEQLSAVLAERKVYIADGHHRYETMCAFRRELEAAGRGSVARFGMIYLSNLDDEGLVVLPTHRLVHGLGAVDLGAVLESVAPQFDAVETDLPADVASLRDTLGAAGESGAAFALSVPGSGRMHVLSLREDFSPEAAGLGELAPALQRLDVTLLHELVLERALGITKQAQAAKTNLAYYKSSEAALAVARDGDEQTQLCCFMNASRVHDVVAVCDSGEVMPQKSTFFFPKIPTGLVFHDLSSAG
jgi:uncharacterized protein (DUF1015 family)